MYAYLEGLQPGKELDEYSSQVPPKDRSERIVLIYKCTYAFFLLQDVNYNHLPIYFDNFQMLPHSLHTCNKPPMWNRIVPECNKLFLSQILNDHKDNHIAHLFFSSYVLINACRGFFIWIAESTSIQRYCSLYWLIWTLILWLGELAIFKLSTETIMFTEALSRLSPITGISNASEIYHRQCYQTQDTFTRYENKLPYHVFEQLRDTYSLCLCHCCHQLQN